MILKTTSYWSVRQDLPNTSEMSDHMISPFRPLSRQSASGFNSAPGRFANLDPLGTWCLAIEQNQCRLDKLKKGPCGTLLQFIGRDDKIYEIHPCISPSGPLSRQTAPAFKSAPGRFVNLDTLGTLCLALEQNYCPICKLEGHPKGGLLVYWSGRQDLRNTSLYFAFQAAVAQNAPAFKSAPGRFVNLGYARAYCAR